MLKTTENGKNKPRVWGKNSRVLAGAKRNRRLADVPAEPPAPDAWRFGVWRYGSPP